MIPWTTLFRFLGFEAMYLKDPDFTFGWSFSFSYGKFHMGMGVNPDYKESR
jgi:hypothetical protein